MDKTTRTRDITQYRHILAAFVFILTLVVLLCSVFEPRWETNDDVAMSMVAHGYGLAAYGSPNLIFSNVLWAYFVRALPNINGILGYSTGTLLALFAVGWSTLYFLLRLGVTYSAGFLIIGILLARPILFPQFTVNAGLLAMAGVIGWQVYARCGGIGNLITSCLLAFFAYLVRDQEFFLVMAVASPLFPWKVLRQQRLMQAAIIVLIAVISLAKVSDNYAYSGDAWQTFKSINVARAPFTDFGAGARLKVRPDIMARHGLSANDVELISNWFFVDKQLTNPTNLNSIVAELGHIRVRADSLANGIVGLNALMNTTLLPILVAALLLACIFPNYRLSATYALCLTAIFALGVMGRPGILRVYVPLISLLLVAPLLTPSPKQKGHHRTLVLALGLACIANMYVVMPQSIASRLLTQKVRQDLTSAPKEVTVIWGSAFPFESAYPVLSRPVVLPLYPLGVFTHAPFSVSASEKRKGQGMIENLLSRKGILIVADNKQFDMLNTYCSERLSWRFRRETVTRTDTINIERAWCEVQK